MIWPLPLFEGFLPASLLAALSLGGPVTWVLVLLSVIAMTIVLFKMMQLAAARRGRTCVARALTHWRNGHRVEALAALRDVTQGMPCIVRLAMQGRTTQASDVLLREEVQRVATAHMERLRDHLRTLEVIGQIGPLLGLFGTVLGMIEAFRRMEEAGSQVDPSVLSGGIWQALLTTGVGLGVSIPVMLVHHWLERRCDAHAHRMEDAVTQVFTSDLQPSDPAVAALDSGGACVGKAHAA